MATGENVQNTSEETYEFICTSCAEDGLIKEALKYCLDCQRYCCKDCLVSHRRIPVTKGHSFLDNTAVKPQGLTRTLPAFPTKQCSKHARKILDMYCVDHNDVCCYVCAAEDHRSCDDVVSVSDSIDQLYNKTDTSKTVSDIDRVLDELKGRQTDSDVLLQRLRDSKDSAIKAANDFRLEMEQLIKELEEDSINEINNECEKQEAQLLDEKRIYEDYIEDLKKLKQQLSQASGNVAQQFVCSKHAQTNIKIIEASEIYSSGIRHAEVIFQSNEELKTNLESMTSLGKTTFKISRYSKPYNVENICDMNVKLPDDSCNCGIFGSCIVNDTVLLTDFWNKKLKRYDIPSSSLLDYCTLPICPRGICIVDNAQVAVACLHKIQFVTINDNNVSLSRSFKVNHASFGIAYNDNKLYITDERKSLYMYDMVGNLLKSVTTDNDGQALFVSCYYITFSDYNDRLFVADYKKGLDCFNTECEYIETLQYSEVKPIDVCVDGSGNIIVANHGLQSIVQCDRDGHKMGIIVNTAESKVYPCSVCIHPRLNRMFVTSRTNKVQIYQLY